jgi:hypothetical protein
MSKCNRIVVDVIFLAQADADAGIKALRHAGYGVLIAIDIVDEDSDETVYVEVHKDLSADEAVEWPLPRLKPGTDCTDKDYPPIMNTVWAEVDDIAEQFDGSCDSCGPVDDDYVPFSVYHCETRWRRAA